MIERAGRVIAIHAEVMQIEVDTASACGHCSSKKNCHGEHTGKVFSLPLEPGYRPGDAITLHIAARSLNLSALLAYLLPAIAMILGAWLGDAWQGNAASMLGAALGIAAGLLLARHLAQRFGGADTQADCFQPTILSSGSSQ